MENISTDICPAQRNPLYGGNGPGLVTSKVQVHEVLVLFIYARGTSFNWLKACYELPASIFLLTHGSNVQCATQPALTLYGDGHVVIHKGQPAMGALSLHNSLPPRRFAFLSSHLLISECWF
ncbi:hypothetical protein PoMZ_12919 [Pyricularia oryzae]|uniref:Uncharacterized protein n=1 Tax=Pyricularia oryzae TaxID=318829 RepID=A0A4P7NU86_PYROR|nr:hypothetical protein PoMZ_12919 [Pyricularia oryzae]